MAPDVPSKRSWSEVERHPSYTPLLPKIGALLRYMVRCGDQSLTPRTSPFSGSSAAVCSIDDYLIRICKYSKSSSHVFPLMVLYMDRLLSYVQWELTSSNVHRVIAAAFTTTAKIHDDAFYSNTYYASVLGLSLKDLNRMEAELLNCLEWDLYVEKDWYMDFIGPLKTFTDPDCQKADPGTPVTGAAQAVGAAPAGFESRPPPLSPPHCARAAPAGPDLE